MKSRISIRSRAPQASSPLVRRIMQANTNRETAIEMKVRSSLHMAGLRFRKEESPVAGLRCKADVVFRRQKVCIFIDGCFWHGCPKHFVNPNVNAGWWQEKIAANRERDRIQTRLLRAHGWVVLRYWEHEIDQKSLPHIAADVRKALGGATGG